MGATISDIIDVMETFAPAFIAEKWDNIGMQVGQKDWPVKTVWVALDPGYNVVTSACNNNVDLLITHHPLLFKPLSSIDFSSPVGSIIHLAMQHRLAIFAAHTNLDKAQNGLNDVLADMLGLKNLKVLEKTKGKNIYKLVVYVPVEYEQKVFNALFDPNHSLGVGEVGEYTCCSFRNNGKGSFKPGSKSKPFIGRQNEVSDVDEIRMETIVQESEISRVIEHLKKNHPYETPAYDIYPLITSENKQGLGRIGEIDQQTNLASFALAIKEKLGIKSVKVAGDLDLPVKTAAVCSGSGSGLINQFISSGAQVYISGDLRYHDARAVEAAGLGLIDIGHFASEHLIVNFLADRLGKILHKRGIDVNVNACGFESDPFVAM